MFQLIELVVILGLVGSVLFGLHKAWDNFKQSTAAPYVAAQKAADQKVLDTAQAAQQAAETDRDTARGNSAKCEATLKVSQQAVEEWSQAALRAATASKAQQAAAKAEAQKQAPYIADLQAKAAAEPKLQSCEAELQQAADVIREELRRRRNAK